MPVSTNAAGSLNPDAGLEALATFKGVADPIQARGHVPAPPAGTSADSVLRADATWGTGGLPASLVPAMAFTGSATGTPPQTYQNNYLKLYSLPQDVQLFVNRTTKLIGGPLGSDFTLDNVTGTITINVTVGASANFFIDSKVLTGVGQTYFFLDETGLNRFLSENGIDLFRTETP